MRTVFCTKLAQEAEGLPKPPYPGPLGERIYQHISLAAWRQWQSHQTMLINEYRLNLIEPKDIEFLEQEMEKFLFGDGSDRPPGFKEE